MGSKKERADLMPRWLVNQLQRAFRAKDRKQVILLNDCWFFYRKTEHTNKYMDRSAAAFRSTHSAPNQQREW